MKNNKFLVVEVRKTTQGTFIPLTFVPNGLARVAFVPLDMPEDELLASWRLLKGEAP